jgi:hypothetical protein
MTKKMMSVRTRVSTISRRHPRAGRLVTGGSIGAGLSDRGSLHALLAIALTRSRRVNFDA